MTDQNPNMPSATQSPPNQQTTPPPVSAQRPAPPASRPAGQPPAQGKEAADKGPGSRPSVVQRPLNVSPSEIGAQAIMDAEAARTREIDEAHADQYRDLPAATLAEMDAGKAALKRHAPAANQTSANTDVTERNSVQPPKA